MITNVIVCSKDPLNKVPDRWYDSAFMGHKYLENMSSLSPKTRYTNHSGNFSTCGG